MSIVTAISIGDPVVPVAADHNLMKKASPVRAFTATPEGEGETIIVEVDVEVPRAIRYNMRGYYPAGQEFEYWQTTNPEENPPSGNPLIDITQVSTFT